jgi:hypothetical protein
MARQKKTAVKKTPSKTIDVEAEVVENKNEAVPQEGKNFTVDFKGMDEVIQYLSKQLQDPGEIKFNPFTREFTFSDGTSIRSGFFTETMTKMSHYINVVNRVMSTSTTGMHPMIQNIQMHPPKKSED